jgi:hypothetical protein
VEHVVQGGAELERLLLAVLLPALRQGLEVMHSEVLAGQGLQAAVPVMVELCAVAVVVVRRQPLSSDSLLTRMVVLVALVKYE